MRLIAIILLLLTTAVTSLAANYQLEIIHPRAGLTITNRAYKAYPGVEYNIRAVVTGGLYPYTFALTHYPAGMEINTTTGEIVWSNPVSTGSPHDVTMQVTDAENNTATVSWTVNVTTTGFIFVDSANGSASTCNGGEANGTIDNPFATIADFYCGETYTSKADSTYAGQFVYFRSGTYEVAGYRNTVDVDVAFSSDDKPLVWLAYPGEEPVIDQNNDGYRPRFYSNGSDRIYLDGLTFINMRSYGFDVTSSQGYMVFRRLTMYNLGPSAGNNNQSFIRLVASGQGEGLSIQDCELYNLDHGAAIKLYQTTKFVIEDNYIHDITDTLGGSLEGIALKQSIARGSVRNNRIYNVPSNGINGNMSNDNGPTEDNEISYNRVWGNCSGGTSIYINQDEQATQNYFFRNTLECPVYVRYAATGPFYIYNNVIQSSSPQIGGETSTVVDTNNLKGTSGLVAVDGSLVNRAYVGTYGWEVGGSGAVHGGRLTGSLSGGGVMRWCPSAAPCSTPSPPRDIDANENSA